MMRLAINDNTEYNVMKVPHDNYIFFINPADKYRYCYQIFNIDQLWMLFDLQEPRYHKIIWAEDDSEIYYIKSDGEKVKFTDEVKVELDKLAKEIGVKK